MIKKTVIVVSLVSVVLLILLIALLIRVYNPYMKHRSFVDATVKNGLTIFTNDEFSFSFTISGNCSLKSKYENFILTKSWEGRLICDSGRKVVKLFVLDQISTISPGNYDELERLPGLTRAYTRPRLKDDSSQSLNIKDHSGKMEFVIFGDTKTINEISSSLKEDI